MKKELEGLDPQKVWEHFYQISQIPRESGNEQAVGQYIISVAKRNNLSHTQDKIGNVLVRCPASKGMEKSEKVVIQNHIDMVCEKNKDTIHDFSKDPIQLIKEGEWIHANGTTLGSDNGIGVSFALTLMEDKNVDHPPLELLFTVDEETGLTGASGLQPGFLQGKILINLDSEEEGAFYIGCAGGKHTILRKEVEWRAAPSGYQALNLKISGLQGGHSGLNIHQGLGNSIKLLSRILFNLKDKTDFALAGISGGNKHNAIPREAEATILLPQNSVKNISIYVREMDEVLKKEYQFSDKNVTAKLETAESVEKVFSQSFQNKLVNLIYAMPHGVMAMSHAVEGLVETSTNMAVVEIKGKNIELLTSQRSSLASSIQDIADKVKALGALAEFEVEQGGGYPAWEPNPDSPLLKLAVKTYENVYKKSPSVKAIHAGLECGIIGEKYPGMDMISFGPTIQGAHSPDERVLIPTVVKCWKYLTTLLKEM